MEIKDFRCPICDTVGKWTNIDEYRMKPHDMHICDVCSFITYPKRYEKNADAKAYYKSDYRQPPMANNLHTGNKKLHYHTAFLKEFIDKWKEKETFKVCDVGAAYGIFLNWFKSAVPKAEIYGTEWDLAFRRNAFHEYGINLSEEIDTTIKYDLISLYHVAEHMVDVDKELLKLKSCLSEDGMLYIAAPVWFDHFHNSTERGGELEYLYHPDHVNVWSRSHLESLIRKCGFEIVKENHIFYGSTYLCKPTEEELPTIELPTRKEIVGSLAKIKKAFEHVMKNEYKEAFETWENYPNAYRMHYEKNRKEFDSLGWEHIQNFIEFAISKCPGMGDMESLGGDICMRYERYELAIEYFDRLAQKSPNSALALVNMSQAYRLMANKETDEEVKIKLYTRAREIMRFAKQCTMAGHDEMYNWMYKDNSHIPIPGE